MRERLGLGDRFVCSYFGTMGEANDLTQVVEAAPLGAGRGVAFVLHGDGKRAGGAHGEGAAASTTSIFSEPIPDKTSVARLAAASDACMTIYKDVPMLATCSPNKLFDTFAAGRPAVVNTRRLDAGARGGERRRGLRPARRPRGSGRAGQSFAPPDEDMGRNAAALAEAEFSRELLAERMLEVLERGRGG